MIRNLWRRLVEFVRDPYKGAREQAEREIADIEAWVKAGAPEGGWAKLKKERRWWL
ncbi:hypothetical protein [Cupriavidus taiwanensis]|uniref:Uncharacterized protein n=1 Tax=Cupriavidus taiwanensis (strain DSM 17343 / BCRC 17206 / CCUG 44338 / CIP 107171 / LMG 19424 / R1) TaxID=977880 RepID=B3R9K9_CUPTR|nr:hypothetical protein [Cupriavidus taiwanensis]CAQ71584.1 hypothetical protein RALTA_B0973 [Cupriavidus taiwanensis LMG 19424]